MIERTLQTFLLDRAGRHPVVTVTGPRQSGKTTLCRMAFPGKPYVSLENPAEREFALEDPVGFLSRFETGGVFDEVQRAPGLLSYLQGIVDEDPEPGRYVLTGSRNLALMEGVSQSLAGRTALLELLPLGLEEVRRFSGAPSGLFETVWAGGYPRIYQQRLPPREWLADYTATYVERDVRQILNVGDLTLFQTFLRLCAGRTGQVLNLSALAADCGVTHSTARAWLSVLEAGYICFRLPPFHTNLGKRLTKSPKLYFFDSGLACSLLGIEMPEQLETHPLRGAVFETWVVSEIAKRHFHRGVRPRLYFYRDRSGLEIDLLIDRASDLAAVEIKSSKTASAGFFAPFEKLAQRLAAPKPVPRFRLASRTTVYGGDDTQERRHGKLLAWTDLDSHVV